MTHQQDERGDPLSRTHDPVRKTYSAREARQGDPGRPILTVLGASLVLAFLVWGAVAIWGERIDPSAPVDRTQTSSTTSGTPTQDTIDGDSQRVTPDGNAN